MQGRMKIGFENYSKKKFFLEPYWKTLLIPKGIEQDQRKRKRWSFIA